MEVSRLWQVLRPQRDRVPILQRGLHPLMVSIALHAFIYHGYGGDKVQ